MNNKWIPTLVTVLVAVVGSLTPEIQTYIAAHPQTALILAALYAAVKGLLPSPVAGK